MAKNDPDLLISSKEKTEKLPDPVANLLHSFVDKYVKGETSIGFYGVIRSADPLGFSAALCVPLVDDKIRMTISTLDDTKVDKVARNDGKHPDKESTLNSDQDETSRKEKSFAWFKSKLIPVLEQETEGIRIVGNADMMKPYIARGDSSPTAVTIKIAVEEMSDSFANTLMLHEYTKQKVCPLVVPLLLIASAVIMVVILYVCKAW